MKRKGLWLGIAALGSITCAGALYVNQQTKGRFKANTDSRFSKRAFDHAAMAAQLERGVIDYGALVISE